MLTRTPNMHRYLRASGEGQCCRQVDAACISSGLGLALNHQVPRSYAVGQDLNPPNAGAHEFDEAATV